MWKVVLTLFVVLNIIRAVLVENESAPKILENAELKYNSASKKVKRCIQLKTYPEIWFSDHSTFDFIVVGSGSSGAVIANRLTETNATVLLLEVGQQASDLVDIPPLAPILQFTHLNWNYRMEKQKNMCLGLVEQKMPWPRGKALGGTTIINYLIHVRGNKRDYNRWAKMGNPGWSYQDVLKYFIKSENFLVKKQDPEYHGRKGYLAVQDVPFRTEAVYTFIKAAQERGHPYVDYNGKQQMGVSYVQATTRNGRRSSSEEAYLRNFIYRRNLKILTKSRAIKVLIDLKTKKAYGVKFVKDRKIKTALASKEVILSAGAFNSPQLLMLSGIGPKSHLEELNIPVLKDLPVGQKMYDHLTFLGLVFKVNQPIVMRQEVAFDPIAILSYIFKGRGPLTTLGGVEGLLYFKTNVSDDPEPYPDMELIFISGGLQTDKGKFYRKVFGITDEIYNTVWKSLEKESAWSVFPMLVHPKSYGYLKLKSKNPFDVPKFYGNYFTDPENKDIKTFIAAIREVQRIAKAPAFQKFGTEQVKTPIPGCQHLVFDSDEYWECALRHISATLHHQVATCKMGPKTDPEAVVDHELKVHGIQNLRVADTSVIPLPLTAHTSVPAFMIGEKAADIIKEYWKI